MLIDSHCHLDYFQDPKRIIEEAKKAGVGRILSCSVDRESMGKNLLLSARFPEVYCCLGIHPTNLLGMSESEVEECFSFIGKNLGKAAAIGEIGLDYKHAKSRENREKQEKVFRRLVSLAIEAGKPVVVHSRYSGKKCLDVLEELGILKVHMHWFTDDEKQAKRAVSLGCFISCSPSIISNESAALVAREIPLENLLLETDAPVIFDGVESEPSWIPKLCKRIAELKGTSEKEISLAVGKNFEALCGK